jgi:hypothetical protein
VVDVEGVGAISVGISNIVGVIEEVGADDDNTGAGEPANRRLKSKQDCPRYIHTFNFHLIL